MRVFLQLTRLEQSLFGMPFLILGALLPWLLFDEPFLTSRLPFLFLGFFTARISGMAFNQWIDRGFDAKNPRTSDRPLPAKKVKESRVALLAWGALLGMVLVGYSLGSFVFLLVLIAAFFLWLYSYLKRVTLLCHAVLGLIHFLSPLIAYVAMGGSAPWIAIFTLGLSAFFSILGSDILYAIADISFDRREHLFSVPAKLGERKSLLLGNLFHGAAIFSLFCFGVVIAAHFLFFLGVALLALYKLTRGKNEGLSFNVVFSTIALLFTLLDRLWVAML